MERDLGLLMEIRRWNGTEQLAELDGWKQLKGDTDLRTLAAADGWLPGRTIRVDTRTGLVKEIELSHQQIANVVPWESVCELNRMEVLSLHHCQLKGRVPTMIAKLRALHTLDLCHNMLTGHIPKDMGARDCVPSLKDLYLSGVFKWQVQVFGQDPLC